jgi:chemotaxis protein CheX
MNALDEKELKLFVDSVRNYFKVTTEETPNVTSAYLATDEIEHHEYNGIVHFAGSYSGRVLVSMPSQLLRRLLAVQGETTLSESNMLDAVGEITNTLAGNARKLFGQNLEISVPTKFVGSPAAQGDRVRKLPYAITLRWARMPALVCVDLARSH